MNDPFQTLGVARTATDAEIKAAFRKLAIQYHPDKNPGDPTAEAKFKDVNAAYQVLSDPQKKAEALNPRQGFREFHFNTGDFGQGQAPFGFEDIFNAFNAQRMRKNNDLQVTARMTLEQAFEGIEAVMELQTRVGQRHASVKIPPGVDTNSRLRVSGEGERVYSDLAPGDLYVTIQVMPHSVYERINQNLMIRVEIGAFQAMLGTKINVPVISGETVEVTVPQGVQPGQKLRVSGHGMPNVHGGARGDLIVVLAVSIPALSDEQRALIEQVQAISIAS
jgi:curved DNA-binding protein